MLKSRHVVIRLVQVSSDLQGIVVVLVPHVGSKATPMGSQAVMRMHRWPARRACSTTTATGPGSRAEGYFGFRFRLMMEQLRRQRVGWLQIVLESWLPRADRRGR